MPASHEFLESAEAHLRVRADSLGELAAEAGRALAHLALRDRWQGGGGSWQRVEVEAPDRARLLVEWLNELIYRAEAHSWHAVEFVVEEAGDTRLVVRARGVEAAELVSPVKAATYHGLRIEDTTQGLVADVIFDV
jgi:SHS2 domain-containing protein